jgi:hypothetical protein
VSDPIRSPTSAPTNAPVSGPSCVGPTYWLWDPEGDTELEELKDGAELCVSSPYNIEVRACADPETTPVKLLLEDESYDQVRYNEEYCYPFYLWGDDTEGDVFPSKKPLRKGTYYLTSWVDGIEDQISFVQTCEDECTETTYWIWDPEDDSEVEQLEDGASLCIAEPYNIEVRPCPGPESLPVKLALKKRWSYIKKKSEYDAPYFLWGAKTLDGDLDVLPNRKRLRRGWYRLKVWIDGDEEEIKFEQTC